MDIDFQTDLSNGYVIEIGDNPQPVYGNRALLNRFQITFLTSIRRFVMNSDSVVSDNYGGDAGRFMNKSHILKDIQSISASISIAIDQTVACIKGDEPFNIPDTERIESATLVSIDIIEEMVYAVIEVKPLQIELYEDLKFRLPIVKR
jgi:hypothetical protein